MGSLEGDYCCPQSNQQRTKEGDYIILYPMWDKEKKNTELARGSEPKDLWTKQSNALTLG